MLVPTVGMLGAAVAPGGPAAVPQTFTMIDVAGLLGTPTDIDTQPSGMTNAGDVVGAYGYDDAGVTGDGVYRSKGGAYSRVVIPGALRTVAMGIAEGGLVTGYYVDAASGRWIGFVARAADVIAP